MPKGPHGAGEAHVDNALHITGVSPRFRRSRLKVAFWVGVLKVLKDRQGFLDKGAIIELKRRDGTGARARCSGSYADPLPYSPQFVPQAGDSLPALAPSDKA